MSFEPKDIPALSVDNKVGVLATLDPGRLPHLTLISTLEPAGPDRVAWGQFCEGRSKDNIRERPETGFLFMTLDRRVWTGKARWTDAARSGDDHTRFNLKPLFRYNAYFGIHTVHYMDVVALSPARGLDLVGIAAGTLLTTVALPFARRPGPVPALSSWALGLLRRPDTFKFVSWVDEDGFPLIVPVVPGTAPQADRVLLALGRPIRPGTSVAVLGMNLKMQSVMVRGPWRPVGRGMGVVDIDHVYNSMPPQQGVIWPREELRPVTDFQ